MRVAIWHIVVYGGHDDSQTPHILISNPLILVCLIKYFFTFQNILDSRLY